MLIVFLSHNYSKIYFKKALSVELFTHAKIM